MKASGCIGACTHEGRDHRGSKNDIGVHREHLVSDDGQTALATGDTKDDAMSILPIDVMIQSREKCLRFDC